jgi:DNA-directed RNA polymerase specialized sigma24 family protein
MGDVTRAADPELLAVVLRYVRKYAPTVPHLRDEFEAAAYASLAESAASWDESDPSGTPLVAWVLVNLRYALCGVADASLPFGYRDPGSRDGSPEVVSLNPTTDGPDGSGPVGDEADYQDLVEAMAAGLTGLQAAVFRRRWLRCDYRPEAIARELGVPVYRVEAARAAAYAAIRRAFPDPARLTG